MCECINSSLLLYFDRPFQQNTSRKLGQISALSLSCSLQKVMSGNSQTHNELTKDSQRFLTFAMSRVAKGSMTVPGWDENTGCTKSTEWPRAADNIFLNIPIQPGEPDYSFFSLQRHLVWDLQLSLQVSMGVIDRLINQSEKCIFCLISLCTLCKKIKKKKKINLAV